MHYYQFHIGDYISHTIHLSLEEDLAYRRLLDMYYDTEQPIPNNIPLVSRRLRLGSDVVQSVLDEFFDASDEGYKNRRADLEISEYHAFINKQRNNGKLGGRPKKTQRKPTANPDHSQNNPNQEPLTTNQEPKRENATKVACPPDVGQQEWEDWLALRKAKKAPVTETVLKSARKEAEKAGITLNAFLTIWCARGSQGLQADWLKTNERQTFAQQAADIARTTVPAQHSGPDPVLLKIQQDRLKAVPPSLETLAKMAELKRKVV
jgi:uncharacterized protein YdaU (DUF1376 family)